MCMALVHSNKTYTNQVIGEHIHILCRHYKYKRANTPLWTVKHRGTSSDTLRLYATVARMRIRKHGHTESSPRNPKTQAVSDISAALISDTSEACSRKFTQVRQFMFTMKKGRLANMIPSGRRPIHSRSPSMTELDWKRCKSKAFSCMLLYYPIRLG